MNIAAGYEWATHQPVIRAVMDLYQPQYVLELGPGIYSTPVFLEYNLTFDCIENDAVWISYLNEKYNLNVIHHDLGNISADITFDELDFNQKKQIIDCYSQIATPNIYPRLLFVDQYCACRMLSISALHNKFSIIIYHDSELKVNRYDLVNNAGFIVYKLETEKSHTTLMVRDYKPELETVIIPYIEQFKHEYPDCQRMNFMKL